MDNYPFIFSDEKRYRIKRHVVFWTLWWLFQGFLYSFAVGIFNFPYFKRLPLSLLESLIFLAPHMFLAYSLMYIVVPRYLLKAKYVATALAVIFAFIITGIIASFIGVNIITPIRRYISSSFNPHVSQVHFFLGLLAGLRGAITIGGIAAAIKLMKHLYLKEERNLQLQKENVTSQLELLKAQVHPHFLFNTLNNIYASVQVTEPGAAKMIISLSELLRHMLYECSKPLITLNKELDMLQQYISLEQVRYGDDLDVVVNLPLQQTGNYNIAPLMLLPFVENCFKHGASKMIDQPWIQLTVSIQDDMLHMKLLNGKPSMVAASAKGIGLTNVRRRLQLLYGNNYVLEINNETDVFIVNLKIPLEKIKTRTIQLNNTVAAYA